MGKQPPARADRQDDQATGHGSGAAPRRRGAPCLTRLGRSSPSRGSPRPASPTSWSGPAPSVGSLYHHFGGKSELFLALWHEHQQTHEEAASKAVARLRKAGVTDTTELFCAGARAFLEGSWLRRDLALLFFSGDGPPGFEVMKRRRGSEWVAQNDALLGLPDTPPDRLYAAMLTSLIGEGAREVATAPNRRQANRDHRRGPRVRPAAAGPPARAAAGPLTTWPPARRVPDRCLESDSRIIDRSRARRRPAMDLDLGPEIAQFRAELRDWIAARRAGRARRAAPTGTRRSTTGGYRSEELAEALRAPRLRGVGARAGRRQADLPAVAGRVRRPGHGRGAGRGAERGVLPGGLPRVIRGMGEALVGPSVIVHGTRSSAGTSCPASSAARTSTARASPSPITAPTSPAVQTRGEVDGDEIVITGQKVWTSGAARATMMFVAVPDRPGAPRSTRACPTC